MVSVDLANRNCQIVLDPKKFRACIDLQFAAHFGVTGGLTGRSRETLDGPFFASPGGHLSLGNGQALCDEPGITGFHSQVERSQ